MCVFVCVCVCVCVCVSTSSVFSGLSPSIQNEAPAPPNAPSSVATGPAIENMEPDTDPSQRSKDNKISTHETSFLRKRSTGESCREHNISKTTIRVINTEK